MNSIRPTVMVGVSGSRAAAAALRWAADEARRRNAGLRVVRSWDVEPHALYAPASTQAAPAQQLAAASDELAAVLRTVFGPELPAEISAELVRGAPERILIDRSAEADLLVLGSAAPPSAAGRPVGPVVRACLHRAGCPVVVVGASAGPDIAGPGQQATGRGEAPRPAWSRWMRSSPCSTGGSPSAARMSSSSRLGAATSGCELSHSSGEHEPDPALAGGGAERRTP